MSESTENATGPDNRVTGTSSRVWREVKADPLALIGSIIVVVVLGVALLATIDKHLLDRQIVTALVADPFATNPEVRLASPSAAHPFGTDRQGRDILARLLYGTKTSVAVGVAAVTVAFLVGSIVGVVSAYYGGLTDMVGMRSMDVILSFPAILLAIALMAVLGRGLENIILAIGVVYTPTFARIIRGEVLSVKSESYVEAARAMGYPDWDIMFREIVPNSMTPVIVQASFSLATAIIAEAALSFLGLGVTPPTATWGAMLSSARSVIDRAWWFSVFPGLSIMITVLGFNLLGDSLRDALNPRETEEGQL